mmetsp:Transcript_15339/g.23619  ORF Transcript_15339/g.23619 Transcript_15339/m.23619 type:complete len:208 (+) Transcript_15339:330-953(+)
MTLSSRSGLWKEAAVGSSRAGDSASRSSEMLPWEGTLECPWPKRSRARSSDSSSLFSIPEILPLSSWNSLPWQVRPTCLHPRTCRHLRTCLLPTWLPLRITSNLLHSSSRLSPSSQVSVLLQVSLECILLLKVMLSLLPDTPSSKLPILLLSNSHTLLLKPELILLNSLVRTLLNNPGATLLSSLATLPPSLNSPTECNRSTPSSQE